ncbi:cardiolipin synthase [Mucilaginibacter sp. S1162]|uniref:Cardiolipin synthase n=1 Tax=Mucilaginibacter humi TaxID=2732510 RepID=A0ABX1W4A4_9SPHI|nr:cardiolipin synthase [Mucilaginibacter humi]NNU34114.1 cardiolipin synthase [Mucilaginibacter humi]
MHWYIICALYVLLVLFVCGKVLYDIRSTSKTFAYLLVVILIPGIGIIIYFAVGANYRKNKLYSKKIGRDNKLLVELRQKIVNESEKALDSGEPEVNNHKKLVRLLLNDRSPLTGNNNVKLLYNGEEKFPEVLKALRAAKHHIHLEYYIFEDGDIADQIKDILVQKAAEGVKVRFIYDDFGSRSIRKEFVRELIAAGVEAYPFYKIWFIALSNRTNYRNHRKIIVIDGHTAFVGGINVSDRYINNNPKQLFWRDTHVMIKGPGIYYLQYLFICDWNFCAEQNLPIEPGYFSSEQTNGDAIVQMAASGPDSDNPTIMYSLLETIGSTKEELLITSPYFIPGEPILDALCVAALSGVKVKLLVPDKSDSRLVNAAARSYYGMLLEAGIEVYLYQKGFVHSKTLVSDGQLAIVGTANMDHRSFELNFEVNCMIYDDKIAAQLRRAFADDIKDAKQINARTWAKRTLFKQLPEKLCRLLAPLL